MDGKPAKRPVSNVFTVIVVVALIGSLPILYVLSLGPVVLLLESGRLDRSWEPAVIAFYHPISLASKYIPGCQFIVNEYVNWWTSMVTPPPQSLVP